MKNNFDVLKEANLILGKNAKTNTNKTPKYQKMNWYVVAMALLGIVFIGIAIINLTFWFIIK